jgi:hypothetical protein
MEGEEGHIKMGFLVWVPPFFTIIAVIVAVCVFQSDSHAGEYTVPSLFAASQYEPVGKITAILVGHAVIAFVVISYLYADALLVKAVKGSRYFRYLALAACLCMFVALWCTFQEQFYVNVTFCCLFIGCCVGYTLLNYLVLKEDSYMKGVRGNLIRMVFVVLNTCFFVLWFSFMVASGREKKGIFSALKAVWGFCLIVTLNSFVIYLRPTLSQVDVEVVLEDDNWD